MKYACEKCHKVLDDFWDKEKLAIVTTKHDGISDTFVLCEKCYDKLKCFLSFTEGDGGNV